MCHRYEASNELFGDVDCQKKAICEIYQNPQKLGLFGERARHGLDMMESFSYMSLPDEFFNILDEFMVSLFNNITLSIIMIEIQKDTS